MVLGVAERPVRADAAGRSATTERGSSGTRDRLAALRRRLRGPDPAVGRQDRVRVLEDARALLERARELVAAGWVQDAFYVVRDRQDQLRPVSPFGLLLLSRTDVVGACLVGAVAHASSEVDRSRRRAPAALAVDTLWTALAERSGRPGVEPVDTPHPAARAARVRELARWNDEPQRTREDVLDLLDRAVSRTILSAVR